MVVIERHTRRTPQQERSRAKVQATLDAAAALIEAEGPDGVTTKSVASEAGFSVGTIYNYFESVDAIFDALVDRHVEKYLGEIRTLLEENDFADLGEAVVAVFDLSVRFFRRERGFRRLWFHTGAFDRYRKATQGDRNIFRALNDAYRGAGLLASAPERADLDRLVTWTYGSSLLELAFAMDPKGHEGVLERARALVRSGAMTLDAR